MKWLMVIIFATAQYCAVAQLYIEAGTDIYLQKGSTISAEADVESFSPVSGDGLFAFSGTSSQQLNMHGNNISGLLNENKSGLYITGDIGIEKVLALNGSNLILGANKMVLGENAVVTAGKDLYINTDGTGSVRKNLSHDLVNYHLPIGVDAYFSPVILNTKGKYSNAFIDIRPLHAAHPDFAASATDYLTTSWQIAKGGINGKVESTILYSEIAVSGKEHALQGFLRNNNKMSPIISPLNVREKNITASIVSDNTELIVMNGNFLNKRIILSPNPVLSTATLSVSSDRNTAGFVRVTDLQGRIVYSKSISFAKGVNQYKIPMYSLRNGVYHVQISDDEKTETFSVTKADR